MKKRTIIIVSLCFLLIGQKGFAQKNQNLPLSTQLTIEKANVYNQTNEILNVFLIENFANQSVGTGFLIKSGHVITNAHVIHGAQLSQLILVSPNGQKYGLSKIASDTIRDLAILTLTQHITEGFELGDDSTVLVGNQVYTWGFPLGYNGPTPLLSVGYIAGVRAYETFPQKFVKHFVVNGALNPGNSGGHLLILVR